MICDFNYPYSPKPDSNPPVSLKERAELTVEHGSNIVSSFFIMIGKIAKVAFYALACAVTIGQNKGFNDRLKAEVQQLLIVAGTLPLSVVGLFAPINATIWIQSLANRVTQLFTPIA